MGRLRGFAKSSFVLAMALVVVGVGSTASAQTPRDGGPANVVAAEILFQEATKLYAAGDYEAACAKFQASYELDTGLGTLLNLGRCYEQLGRTASAWAAYVDLSGLASRAGQADRATIANERVAALAPKLVRLAVHVPREEDIEVLVDGRPLAEALYGTALPVDPGEHRVAARRSGAEPYFETTVTVSEEGATVEVTVEAPGPVEPEPRQPAPIVAPAPVEPAPAPVVDDSGSALWIAGGITGGVGLVALGVSAGFTADAASAWSDAGCTDGFCSDAASQTLSERAGRSADIATGFAIGGGVLAATGAVLIVVALVSGDEGEAEGSDSAIGVSAGGLHVRF